MLKDTEGVGNLRCFRKPLKTSACNYAFEDKIRIITTFMTSQDALQANYIKNLSHSKPRPLLMKFGDYRLIFVAAPRIGDIHVIYVMKSPGISE